MTGAFPDGSEFLTVVYDVAGPEKQALVTARRIAFDQTIEGDEALLTPSPREVVSGHVENLQPARDGRYDATIRFRADLLSGDCCDLLELLFGTSSLRGDVIVRSFAMTPGLLAAWPGPRLGIVGLRKAVGIHDRPLLCAVLKPLGRTPEELAKLAQQFVQAGIDLIKDDQSLVDQRWCPFDERVARCADAIAQASARRGRPCLYFAHVSGAWEVMRRRVEQASTFGATGLLVAPGLTGFDALRALRLEGKLTLPIASHPSLLGAFVARSGCGIAPAVLYGLLPRLVGADLTVFPGFDAGYSMSCGDCVSVATSCRQSWEQIQPIMPAIGGRVGPERVVELTATLGHETVFVLGSRVQLHRGGPTMAIGEFHRAWESKRRREKEPS